MLPYSTDLNTKLRLGMLKNRRFLACYKCKAFETRGQLRLACNWSIAPMHMQSKIALCQHCVAIGNARKCEFPLPLAMTGKAGTDG